MDTPHDDRKVDLIRHLVLQGQGEIIRHLLFGVSTHSVRSNANDVAYPEEFENRDDKGFHLMTWVHAHLEFTAKYGLNLAQVVEGKRRHFAHPAEFEEWLSHGAPGILLEEVESCAREVASRHKSVNE